jgi:hypothetical protein
MLLGSTIKIISKMPYFYCIDHKTTVYFYLNCHFDITCDFI